MPNLGSDHQHVCSGSEVFYSIVSRILGIVYIHARYTRLTISRFATVSKLHVPVTYRLLWKAKFIKPLYDDDQLG